jgi:dephospho-CoA kinase
MKVIGLTGGIGSGKSTVAQLLAELGARAIDLDKTGHAVLQKGSDVYHKAVSEFGQGVLAENGEIDRAKLGKIVFGSPGALKRLNSITHPAIDALVEKEIENSRNKGIKVLVFEAAAMMENDKTRLVDELWITMAPEPAALKRIKERSGYTEEEAKKRIKSQMTDKERIKMADVVIYNNGTMEELKEKVKTEWDRLQKRI